MCNITAIPCSNMLHSISKCWANGYEFSSVIEKQQQLFIHQMEKYHLNGYFFHKFKEALLPQTKKKPASIKHAMYTPIRRLLPQYCLYIKENMFCIKIFQNVLLSSTTRVSNLKNTHKQMKLWFSFLPLNFLYLIFAIENFYYC